MSEPAAAYDLWASSYDSESDNVVLHLEQDVFSRLLKPLHLNGRTVMDFGCGTGRHWHEILERKPASLSGYDVSAKMLHRLKEKFPDAQTLLLNDGMLNETAAASIDVLTSTLVLAHVPSVEKVFQEWSRVVKTGGDILITDFHPAALAHGADRTFRHEGRLISVKSYPHAMESIRSAAKALGWHEIEFTEVKIDQAVEPYYKDRQAETLYERFRGVPLVYGLLLKKT